MCERAKTYNNGHDCSPCQSNLLSLREKIMDDSIVRILWVSSNAISTAGVIIHSANGSLLFCDVSHVDKKYTGP
jgi:hypothetical protein